MSSKDDDRDARLSFRNLAEHQLRRELKNKAVETCRKQVDAFGKCANDKGLMVVFSCQSELKEMNSCLATHNSDEEWEKYKKANEEEIEARAARKKKVIKY
mmetsp:Transcript_2274/g.2927  ORF Transcript_2274/g.2927 Transcript_2274/m.2927 type:complete len:101 (-) Transcript_2274:326-628(-)|eukprot:CAMPEP_0172495080 /NCGR_PEP_ID=MMETSP1066-20121228/63497_1 /TAXON_ID=671091 /ORGANISM="Coscinodiscus wailesii, Strain CCMP2513" /LENGTH=100 /DNA_ID=CAMNT_0013266531 /DNA_START=103 /DNA_END=405 /DNA_ORIENTATION=-